MITEAFSNLYFAISKNLAPKQGAVLDAGHEGLAEQHAIREADTQASAGYVAPDAARGSPPHSKE